jgi:hypothetical protein
MLAPGWRGRSGSVVFAIGLNLSRAGAAQAKPAETGASGGLHPPYARLIRRAEGSFFTVGAPAPAIAVCPSSASRRRVFTAIPCCVSRYCYVTSLKPATAK